MVLLYTPTTVGSWLVEKVEQHKLAFDIIADRLCLVIKHRAVSVSLTKLMFLSIWLLQLVTSHTVVI